MVLEGWVSGGIEGGKGDKSVSIVVGSLETLLSGKSGSLGVELLPIPEQGYRDIESMTRGNGLGHTGSLLTLLFVLGRR